MAKSGQAKQDLQAKQGELAGVRPKRLSMLEAAVRDLLEAKERHKATKEAVDGAADEVARALKEAGETTYGWREDGRLITVSLQDKEVVKVTETKSKAGGKRGETDESRKRIGFGT